MSACSDGAVTLTMKTSAMTMNTGAKSTGRNHGLRRGVEPRASCVPVICEFNGWPPVACELVSGSSGLRFKGQCATMLIQVQERDLSWYQKHHPRALRTATAPASRRSMGRHVAPSLLTSYGTAAK